MRDQRPLIFQVFTHLIIYAFPISLIIKLLTGSSYDISFTVAMFFMVLFLPCFFKQIFRDDGPTISCILFIIFIYMSFTIFMSESYSFLRFSNGLTTSENTSINEIKCYQERPIYYDLSRKIIEDNRSLITFTGPKSTGKTTFFQWMKNHYKGIYYVSINTSNKEDNGTMVKEWVQQALPLTLFAPFFGIYHIFYHYYSYESYLDAMVFSRLIKSFIKEQLGYKPLFIIDNFNLLEKSGKQWNDINDFIIKGMEKGSYKIILAGDESTNFEPFISLYNELSIYSMHTALEFTEAESIAYHTCYLPHDSIETVTKLCKYLKGSIDQYQRYFNIALKAKNRLKDSEVNEIILTLIDKLAVDFKKADIDFEAISNKKGNELSKKNVQNIIQVIYWLIKCQKPIKKNSVSPYLTRETVASIFKTYYNELEITEFIDFKTNLHKIYAARNMGLNDDENFNFRTFHTFSRILTQNNFTLIEYEDLEKRLIEQ